MRSPSPAAWFRRALPTRRRAIAAAAVVVLLAAAVTWAVWPQGSGVRTESAMLTVRSGPSGDQPVDLDTTFYLPTDASSGRKVPAVLLAHGFGGTKESVRSDAEEFAGRGYAVLTWTARGFGRSGGEIHLDSPDHEVRDAQRLLDWLAARPEVRTDGAGDPKVGVVGGSYGGGLALLLAAQDRRVDAIVPMITWNDLSRAFLPESTGGAPTEGVFKKGWAGLFFGGGGNVGSGPAGLSGGTAAQPEGAPASAGPPSPGPGA
ncbi:alpha/beta hydrolase, partial [Micromonospora sp. CV4]|uniref:alpha/beta hydrolase n=1 Tax=Micromonospora sp. CV4 TaxID=2478711 RepID=UPI000F215F04